MANVCINCFTDRELKAFIRSQATSSDCNFCTSKGVDCLPIEELFDFFSEMISHFKPYSRGTPLSTRIQENWNLFSSQSYSDLILNFFLSKVKCQFPHGKEMVDFSDEILENVGYWDQLKQQLTTQNRYITDINYLTDELGWDGLFSSQIEWPQGKKLYRARLHHTSGELPYEPSKMFCPPAGHSTAGRANPAGIPYLYLSDNPATVMYEIRATYLDEVSIGTFEARQDIGQPLLIADFTESGTIFHPSRIGERINATLLKQKISADLSKPLRRYDSELEYIPTQFICEFIKIYTGVSGIKFKSSLHVTGNNIVLFNQDLMICTEVRQVKAKHVVISY